MSRPGRQTALESLRLAVSGLLKAERRLRSRDSSRSGDLTFAQVRSITALGREREMTAGELARSADLNPATVTAMLDHLEATGIVERERSTTDRRVCNVKLTDAGWELFERKQAAWQSLWHERMRGFSADELATAARVLAAVSDVYDAIAARAETPTASQ